MKFQLAINMERLTPDLDMTGVERHTLEMVQMADEGGFTIAWAAEHHALEMTIAPNPFQILTWWAAHTSRIRLGSAVVVAAYWHPIKAAGEAALLDLYSGGRLEFGIGSGAYQREFDRMHPGLQRKDGSRYMNEMLPAVKALWQGDYEHVGEFWSFPAATSVPKPLQKPHPPIWIAARSPDTYDFAVKHDCNILSWPLTRPVSEVELYKERLETAQADNPGKSRPVFATMRHTVVYDRKEEWEGTGEGCDAPVRTVREPVQEPRRRCRRISPDDRPLGAGEPGRVRSAHAPSQPDVWHSGRSDRQAQGLRSDRRRPIHVLREPGSRVERAKAVAGAVHQGSDAGVRVTKQTAARDLDAGLHIAAEEEMASQRSR